MKERKTRLSRDEGRAGRALALKLEREGQLSYKGKVAHLQEATGCGESTASLWLKHAKERILEIETDIVIGDPGMSRWRRVQIWDQRARRWRGVADRRVNDHKYGDAVKCEGASLKYEELIARALHWFATTPEQDLDEPSLRKAVIEIIKRKVDVFATGELTDMLRAVSNELNERQLAPDTPIAAGADRGQSLAASI